MHHTHSIFLYLIHARQAFEITYFNYSTYTWGMIYIYVNVKLERLFKIYNKIYEGKQWMNCILFFSHSNPNSLLNIQLLK